MLLAVNRETDGACEESSCDLSRTLGTFQRELHSFFFLYFKVASHFAIQAKLSLKILYHCAFLNYFMNTRGYVANLNEHLVLLIGATDRIDDDSSPFELHNY